MEVVISELSVDDSPNIKIIVVSPTKKFFDVIKKYSDKVKVRRISQNTVVVTVMLDRFSDYTELLDFINIMKNVFGENVSVAKDGIIHALPNVVKKEKETRYFFEKVNTIYLLTGDEDLCHIIDVLEQKMSQPKYVRCSD